MVYPSLFILSNYIQPFLAIDVCLVDAEPTPYGVPQSVPATAPEPINHISSENMKFIRPLPDMNVFPSSARPLSFLFRIE